MPSLGYEDMSAGVENTTAIVATSSNVRLRPKAADGSYDPNAKFPVNGEYVTFPNIPAYGISKLWAMWGDVADNDGTVDVRLSGDDGVTWKRWNGAAWADDGSWSPLAEVNANIATFPVGEGAIRGIRLRMRLRPDATLKKTPVVHDIGFLCEFDHDFVDDAKRSCKTHLEALRYLVRCREVSPGTNKVVPSLFGFTLDAGLAIQVFNQTDDPGYQTDLFQAYDAGTNTVTLTGAQDSGDVLTVKFFGSCAVHLTTDAMLHLTTMPMVEILMSFDTADPEARGLSVERNKATLKARTRQRAKFRKVVAVVTVGHKNEEMASEMTRAIRTSFEEGEVRSRATGALMRMGEVKPHTGRQNLSTGTFTPNVRVEMWILDPERRYVEDDLITEINTRTTSILSPQTWYDETYKVS